MRKYLPALRRIRKLTVADRRKLFKKCDKQLIDCFCECCKNVLNGNVKLNNRHFNRLRREKNNLRALALKATSLAKKRKILQKGGFIGALLPAVLPVLSSLLGGLFSNGTR